MKKFLLIALAVAMMMTLAISAFAATDNITAVGEASTGDVTVNKTDFYSETVYYVDVTWGDLAFDYTEGTYTWNPNELKYEVKDDSAGWVDADGNTADSVTREDVITVINKSNAAIKAAAGVAAGAITGATVTTSTEFTLDSAAKKNGVEIKDTTTEGTATEGAFDVTVSGTPSGTGTIATITVTITAAE